ncbi:MAG TPA: hypothetical protein VFJ57_11795 [Solirubrobacterales bacterium]|nr:hypothetical protein [Solirubrobacterales bacterium]
MRIAVPISIIALAAAVFAGCGGSSGSDSTETGSGAAPQGGAATAPAGASTVRCVDIGEAESVRLTGVTCEEAKWVLLNWQIRNDCVGSQGISHVACTVRSYRCIATRTERGVSVSCAKPGRSIAFTSKR